MKLIFRAQIRKDRPFARWHTFGYAERLVDAFALAHRSPDLFGRKGGVSGTRIQVTRDGPSWIERPPTWYDVPAVLEDDDEFARFLAETISTKNPIAMAKSPEELK